MLRDGRKIQQSSNQVRYSKSNTGRDGCDQRKRSTGRNDQKRRPKGKRTGGDDQLEETIERDIRLEKTKHTGRDNQKRCSNLKKLISNNNT